jgi:ATP-dependent Clp protease ATP-binding subunit ClpA
MSRITAILPFTPFSLEEKMAICAEAIHSLGGESARTMPSETMEAAILVAVSNYIPAEGARSLYRAVSNQLIDML